MQVLQNFINASFQPWFLIAVVEKKNDNTYMYADNTYMCANLKMWAL